MSGYVWLDCFSEPFAWALFYAAAIICRRSVGEVRGVGQRGKRGRAGLAIVGGAHQIVAEHEIVDAGELLVVPAVAVGANVDRWQATLLLQ